MSYEIKWLRDGVVVKFSGIVSESDLVTSNEHLYTNTQFPSYAYQIFDFEDADLSSLELGFVTNLAISDADKSRSIIMPALAIVTRQAIGEALLFHYRLLADSLGIKSDMKAFETFDIAFEWAASLTQQA
jgi:hypothetical protein